MAVYAFDKRPLEPIKLVVEYLNLTPLGSELKVRTKVLKLSKRLAFAESRIINPKNELVLFKGGSVLGFTDEKMNNGVDLAKL